MNKRKESANDTKNVNTLNIQPLKRMKNKIYCCTFDGCEFETAKTSNMLNHKKSHYPNLFWCGINNCEQTFKTQYFLTNHRKEHKNANHKFACNYKDCTFATIRLERMKIHTILHSIDTLYVCGIIDCRETFVSQRTLNLHREIHKTNGKYVCDFANCEYSSHSAHYFQTHRMTHLETRPFKCDHCTCTFVSQQHLNQHMSVHTGAREFVCKVETCNATFKTSSSLCHHTQLKHSDFEGFECLTKDCGKKFTTKNNLERHVNSQHAEEKTRYECEECGQEYPRKDSLIQHIRDHHMEEKRFKCDHCSFKTNRFCNLNSHLETHERQKSYTFVCNMQDGGTQICSKTDIPCTIKCKTQLDLEYHIERNHTQAGIASKFESERKLAEFLTLKGINFTRDQENTIKFTTCKSIDPSKKSARPDFYLICKSAELGVYFILENDEFAHRRNSCDFERLYNIIIALRENAKEIVPIVFVRFNPHHFQRNGIYHSMSLPDAHEKLYKVIHSITLEQLKHDVNLVYVNYDRTNDKLDVFKETKVGDYAEFFEKYVILDV